MKHHCSRGRHGNGLIYAGTIVFLIGLAIVLFKELNIPRYWTPAVIGLLLIIAGFAARSFRRLCQPEQTLDREDN